MKNAELLIISASADLISPIRTVLEEREFNVSSARCADEARNIFASRAIDLILFDLALGDEAAERVVAHGVPVMFLLPEESPAAISRAYALGACDFVSEPVYGDLLLVRLNSQIRLLRGRKKIEKANNDLYEFCMPASHDLKAPFTVISSIMDLLKTELDGQCNEKVEKLLATIGTNSLEIKTLIEAHYAHAQAESCHRGGFVRNID